MANRSHSILAGSAIKTMGLGDLDKYMDWLIDQGSVSGDISVATAFRSVPYIYRCTMLRSQALSAMPLVLERNGTELDPDEPDTKAMTTMLRDALYLAEAGLCLTGAAYFHKQANPAGYLKALQWFSKSTITIEDYEDKGGLRGFTRIVKTIDKFYKPDQLLYFWRVNPLGELGPGPCEADLALTEAGVQKNTFDWASAFFRRGAIPAVILGVEGNPPTEELERLENWWKGLLQGVKRAWEAVAVRASVKPVVVGAPVKDLAMPELDEITRRHICTAFGIHLSMIEEAANYATKKEDRVSFYEDTIIPEGEMMAQTVNKQLLAPMGVTLRFTPQQMDIMQEDESNKSQALANLRQSGLDLLTALEVLGYDLTKEQWQRVKDEEERKRKQAEALQVAAAAAPDKDEEKPGGMNKLPNEQDMNPEMQRSGKAADPFEPRSLLADLRLWRDKSRKRGKLADFESDAIPTGVKAAVTMLGLDAFDALKAVDDALFDAEEAALKREIEKVLAAQLGIAVAAVAAGQAWSAEAFAKAMQDAIDDVLVRIVLKSALRHAVTVGIDFDPAVINQAAWEWARRWTYPLVSGLTNTTRGVVQDAIAKYVATPGMTQGDLRKLLEPAFGDMRAQMIARTEVTRAFARGTAEYQAQLAAMGIDMERVWLTRNDEAVCPICGPLHDKPQEDWPAELQDGPPAHVNCRCGDGLRMRRERKGAEKGNPYHDERGRFASGGASGGYAGSAYFTDSQQAGRAEYSGSISVDRNQYNPMDKAGQRTLLAHEVAHQMVEDKILRDDWDGAERALTVREMNGRRLFVGGETRIGEAIVSATAAHWLDIWPASWPSAARDWLRSAIEQTGYGDTQARRDIERLWGELRDQAK